MSSDNGIYIGHFDDGYRVIHAQAIENIYEGPEFMWQYFGQLPVWRNLDAAYKEALRIEKDLKQYCKNSRYPEVILEYGIQILELGKWPKETGKEPD